MKVNVNFIIFLQNLGKSTSINVVGETLETNEELFMTNTGKSATTIGVTTVFSKKLVLPFQQKKNLRNFQVVQFLEKYRNCTKILA